MRSKGGLTTIVILLTMSAAHGLGQAQSHSNNSSNRIDCTKVIQCAPVSEGCSEITEPNWRPGSKTFSDGQPQYCRRVSCFGKNSPSRDWTEVRQKFDTDPFSELAPGPFELYKVALCAGLKLNPWNGGFMGHVNGGGLDFYDPDSTKRLPVVTWTGVIDMALPPLPSNSSQPPK